MASVSTARVMGLKGFLPFKNKIEKDINNINNKKNQQPPPPLHFMVEDNKPLLHRSFIRFTLKKTWSGRCILRCVAASPRMICTVTEVFVCGKFSYFSW